MDEAKPYACDTWQGLRVWCCGALLEEAAGSSLVDVCVSGSGLEWPAVVGESPVRENMCMRVDDVSRVAAGSWNLL
ncbi:hypothetical protein CIP107578_02501 [Corynebacterium diphtheriae]|nr:hypothetical protein CIP107543_02370 [Corynebacterium diphtheriae]CAB0624416.1 hypothetical protein CIP107558_02499 [Corynebacterium diphtheriae]CAB0671572.1 hypothetical protein CIP107578_02501 [Corynebacterium diphtheriae]